MNQHCVKMKLNQQQLELLDRTLERGVATDRIELIRLALREYAARHPHAAGTAAQRHVGEAA
jgi:metal-responsive CopG/Arc/MetJ family transcriptional regulator